MDPDETGSLTRQPPQFPQAGQSQKYEEDHREQKEADWEDHRDQV